MPEQDGQSPNSNPSRPESFSSRFIPTSLQTMSRRRLLAAGIGLGATATGVAIFGPRAYETLRGPDRQSETPENRYIELGSPKQTSFEKFGMQYLPDGHIPYVTFPDGEQVYFLSANARSFAMMKKDDVLTPRDLDRKGFAIPCIEPDTRVNFRNGYTSITGVFQLDNSNPSHLTAITHFEQWVNPDTFGNYTGSIGTAESKDRGRTWTDIRQLLKAEDALEPGTKVTGVGQPCAILNEVDGQRYLQIYYLYLPANGPYLIHTSRAPIENGNIGEFEHFTKDGFQTGSIRPDTSTPVILPPKAIGDSHAALPSVALYNDGNGDRLVCAYEVRPGFAYSVARNKEGTQWEDGQMIFKFPHDQYPHFMGQRWYSNPTLWSPDQPTDQRLSKTGLLIYSSGVWDKPHVMEFRPFKLKPISQSGA